MVLQLFGASNTTCSRRVATILYEKNVPFIFQPVDVMKGEHKTIEHLERQPFGQVPYIDDDGFILYESRAICQYIATKYEDQGTQLIPSELKAKALFYQASSVETANFDPWAHKAVLEMIFKPRFGKKPDAEAFSSAMTTLSAKLDVYEKILSKQKYLAGDEITLADLYHLPYASLLPKTGTNIFHERPNLARWYGDISSRPSWKAVEDGIKSTV